MTQYFAATAAMLFAMSTSLVAQTVFETTLGDADQTTAEVSTRELQQIIRNGDAVLLDARPPLEYATSHIPGALVVAPQPGRAAHLYVSDVAEVGRLLGQAKNKPLILYCNGPFCGKSNRLAADLVEAGYTSVRRYQLGAPGWRTLSGQAMQTELAALPYIRSDKTAVWIDSRDPAAARSEPVLGARNIPASGLKPGKDRGVVKDAKDDGRLPMDDHNTRIIVFGTNASAVADAIAREAFHNVSFVNATADQVRPIRRPR